MARSLSAIKKDVVSHMDTIANTLHHDGVSVAVLDAFKSSLKSVKKADALGSWYRGYSKRVGELLEHHGHHAPFINDQRHSIERIIGVQR